MIYFKDQKLEKKCIGCGTTIFKTYQRKRKQWEKTKYCSKECFINSYWTEEQKKKFSDKRSGIGNPNFRDGYLKTNKGYIRICVSGKYIHYHRYLMEKHTGRKMLKTDHVHHVNGDKEDNRIENLEIVNNSEHLKRHWRMRKLQMQMRTAN